MAEVMKKPATAYFLWFNAKRETIQKQVGSKDFKVVSGKASELWKKASAAEKKPFEEESKRQVDAFEKFKATPEGQKALEEQKAQKQEEKRAAAEKNEERERVKEEKQVAREKREAKAAVKAVVKDDLLKKPLTAYFSWLNDNRDRIAKLVGSKGAEVAKKGSELWKALAEKDRKPYEEKARKEKEAYDAYLATPEGAAALKAYKEATSAVAYKEPSKTVDEAEEEASPKEPQEVKQEAKLSASQKRKSEETAEKIPPQKKGRRLATLGA